MKLSSSETLIYAIPYILIATFQYSILKDGLNYSSPLMLMAVRNLIASLILFGISRRFHPILNRDLIILSVCTCVSSGSWALGLQFVSPAESAVLSYTMPLFAIPLSMIIVGEKTARNGLVGAIIGFAGVMIYAVPLSRNSSTILGGVLTLVNAASWAAYTAYYRKIRSQDQMMTIATQLLLASIMLVIPASVEGYRLTYSFNFVFDLAYLSILSGAAQFYLWNALARLQKISIMSTVIYVIPAAATLFEFAETRVIPSSLSVVGIFLMLLGIYLSRLKRH